MEDPGSTTQLNETATRLAELRDDVNNIAKLRAFPLLLETILISALLYVFFPHGICFTSVPLALFSVLITFTTRMIWYVHQGMLHLCFYMNFFFFLLGESSPPFPNLRRL
jgi:hypothetical protein